jgi:Na+/H+ antiporter NhaC
MRVPLSLSLSLLFLAVSSCFSSGSETDRFEEKKRAIEETQPPQTHSLAEQKTSSSHIRFIIIIVVIIIIIITAVPVFHFLDKISSLLAYFTHCIF